MASDLSSGCTETIDILDDEKEEGEISLEDVSSSEEGGMGHLTCNYIVRARRPCPSCKSTWGECMSWCNINSKAYHSKSQSRRDPVKGKENRHHVNEAGCASAKHAVSTLQEKNDDLVPISSDSDMEIVGLVDTSKQLANLSKVKVKKKKKKKKDYEYISIDDLIPSSIDLPITECFSDAKVMSISKETNLSRTHYKKSSPFRRSGRSRVISKSPLKKYRSPMRVKSSFGRSRSELSHSRSPPLKRSPRRLRSPKRSNSPYRSPIRTAKKLQRLDSSSIRHVDRYGDVTRLLKKVKHLDSMGAHTSESSISRNKEYQPASLKEKLSNMMKKTQDNNDNVTQDLKEKSLVQPMIVNDADDEEDLALLRQKALETKQRNRPNRSEHPAEVESEKKSDSMAATKTNDDQDEEDLELRMIALRSAVIKKHQDRVQRGIRRTKNKTSAATISSRSESPFTQSFIDDIPIPGDVLLKFASPPCTPPALLTDSNHIEDMELDTDIEREKEKLPYSPTDKITANVPIDTELLGIEPSDVSFINLNGANNSPVFMATKDEEKPLPVDFVLPNYTYLPHYGSYSKHFAYLPCDTMSRHDDNESFHANMNHDQKILPNYLQNLHGDGNECNLIDGTCCQQDAYSPTDAPMYEEIHDVAQNLPIMRDLPSSSISSDRVFTCLQIQDISKRSDGDLLMDVDLGQSRSIQDNKREITSNYHITESPVASVLGSASPNGSLVTIDDLPETDGDPGSPIDKNSPPGINYIPNNQVTELPCRAGKTVREPLYMQGVPDVTKDVNKIPTLINRTLVPAPILKSNKQLQQLLPLPLKKHDVHPEPTFKSAEMQPVIVTVDASVKNSTTFKPIKLAACAKKSHPVLTTPVVFDDSMNENLENDTSNSDGHKTAEPRHSPVDTTHHTATVNDNVVSASKKRKRVKKNQRKSRNAAESFAQKKNSSCKKDNVNTNVNTIGDTSIPQCSTIAESDRNNSNDDNKMQENLTENKDSSTSQYDNSIQEPSSLVNPTDIGVENRDSVQKNDQHEFSNDKEEPKHAMLSISSKYQQEDIRSSHCASTNSNIAASSKAIEPIKENPDNRRQSVDEDEDELRAILLASLAKRTTKLSDVNSNSAITVTNCDTTNTQVSIQKTLVSTISTATNVVNDNAPLLSILDLPEVDGSVNDANTKEASGKSASLSLGSNRKRSNATAIVKGPPKKIMKKAPTSASMKVVNNAKKCQNTIVRKPNNLQNANALNNKAKPNQDNTWAVNASTKTSSKIYASETQRFVIALGSDTDSESEPEKHQANISVSNIVITNTQQESNTDFETSLHKFLRDMRKEQETAAASKPASSPQATKRDTPPVIQAEPLNTDSTSMQTPLAVKHLPMSQQAEYHRLKQEILEREKLKLQKKVVNKNNNNNHKLLNNTSGSLKSISLHDNETTSVMQNQITFRELEEYVQQPLVENRMKNIDVAKSISILNASRTTSVNETISTNITKQTNSKYLQAKGAKKTVPNINIRITKEITPPHFVAESKVVENLVDSLNKHQPMSDKQQFRPALRTLSKDEINRKYVQIQLKQDMTERVVTINDKLALRHNAAIDQMKKLIENANSITTRNSDETTISKNTDDNSNDEFSNASTVVLANLSTNLSGNKQELMTTMETTMSLSQYEHEREINCNMLISSSPSESSSHKDDRDTSHKSANINDKVNLDNISNTLKKSVRAELDSFARLSEAEQQRYLSDTEHKLVARRYTVLDHLAEMSGNLRQWDMEMDLQSSLAIEVRKLKEQLKIAEERLQAQRNRVNSIGPKISMVRQEINAGRRECDKLSKICSILGNRLTGKDYKLPEAGSQLLSDKFNEVANQTRQVTKKKLSSNDISDNITSLSTSLSQISSLSESSKTTCTEKDISLCKQLVADTVAGSKDDTSCVKQFNDTENLPTLDSSQVLPSQMMPEERNQTSAIVSESHSNEQDQDNVLPSEPKLSSTPISIKQDNKCTQRNRRMDIPELATSSESISSAIEPSLRQDDELNNKKMHSPLPATAMMTMTTTTTIEPYVSILTHLKTPRNANPNGVLCPYDLMGTCNDEDCQFVHQSTGHT